MINLWFHGKIEKNIFGKVIGDACFTSVTTGVARQGALAMIMEVPEGSFVEFAGEILLVNLFAGGLALSENWTVQNLDKTLNNQIARLLDHHAEWSNYGELNIVHCCGDLRRADVLLIGSGQVQQMTTDKLRHLFGNVGRVVRKMKSSSVGIYMKMVYSFSCEATVKAVVEGMVLGQYQFDFYKNKKANKIEAITFFVDDASLRYRMQQAMDLAQITARGVLLCRDLVNHPASHATPVFMADVAQSFQDGLSVEISGQEMVERMGLNAFLVIAKGSEEELRMITIKYSGAPDSKEVLAYVGKGVTFDSGGISLKGRAGMAEMKDDMAGAAAVLTAMQAIAKLKPKVNILAVMPCCENMPSGSAVKPGDVVRSMSGVTIEIDNTDAEGRLLLADAVSYAIVLGATRIVDIATLTGSCLVALGNVASAVVSNHDEFCNTVLHAAQETGEKMWRLPSYEEYRDQLKSDIAEIKNTGGRMAGTITAGMFIERFTNGLPWVHIDIAGTAYLQRENGIYGKGSSGVGVRTLVQLAFDMADKN